MIKIHVTDAAYQAIADSLGGLSRAAARPQGGVWLWLDKTTIGQLTRLRRPGESYSDVILRLAGLEARAQ
jgi:hypothetical protein